MHNKSKDKLLSTHEAAKIAEVHDETVARWIRGEHLKAKKIRIRGRREEWRIKESDLLLLLKE